MSSSFRYVNIPPCKDSLHTEEMKIYKPRDENVNRKTIATFKRDSRDSLYNVEHNLWFTVIPLHDIDISCENIRVKFNPLCRSLIIKLKSTHRITDGRIRRDLRDRCVISRVDSVDKMNIYKPLKYVVNLPKHILVDKLEVKLTQHEELVICAPFKYPQQHQTWLLTLNEETLNSRFLQDKKMRNEFTWINIPIISYSTTSTSISFNKRSYKNEFQQIHAKSTSTSSSEEDVSELEYTTTDEGMNVLSRDGRFSHYSHLNDMKVFVKKYVDLLKDIFYPNVVKVKILKNFQLLLCIKFDEYTYKRDDVIVGVDTRIVDGKMVLIVEGKKIEECEYFNGESNLMKDIRYVIPLPFIFNVEKVLYNVLPNGVVTIKLPILTKKMRDLYELHETVDTLEKKDLYKYLKY